MKKSKVVVLSVICVVFLLGLGGCVFVFSLLDYTSDNVEEATAVTTDESKTTKVSAEPKKKEEAKEIKAPFGIKTGIEGLKVTVNSIKRQDNLLEISITYDNNSGGVVTATDTLTQIVADNEQYEVNWDLTWDINNGNLLDEIENSVSKNTKIIFTGVKANKFNLVFLLNYEKIRINNIVVE